MKSSNIVVSVSDITRRSDHGRRLQVNG